MKKEEAIKPRKWITKKDAARYLSVCLRTLEYWTQSGLIKKYKLGAKVYFDQNQIDDDILNNGRNDILKKNKKTEL